MEQLAEKFPDGTWQSNPSWDDLNPDEKDCWEIAVTAVRLG